VSEPSGQLAAVTVASEHDDMAYISLDGLLACFAIARNGDDEYTAPNVEMEYYRIFGGQLLAQTIAIAAADTGKLVKSMHVVFPREGLTAEAVRFLVERPHDGRAFATRRITGVQDAGKPILVAQISCHTLEESALEVSTEGPEVGRPEDATPTELDMIPFETRVVGGIDLTDRAVRKPEYQAWLKVDRALPDDPAVHQGVLAWCSDLTLIGTTLLPVDGFSQADSPERLHTAPVTHSLWFHRPFRIDDWVLLAQQGHSLSGARGFGTGHAFDADGALVASYAQEAMIREGGR
jgi:acyl-CoA thioesterase-2